MKGSIFLNKPRLNLLSKGVKKNKKNVLTVKNRQFVLIYFKKKSVNKKIQIAEKNF